MRKVTRGVSIHPDYRSNAFRQLLKTWNLLVLGYAFIAASSVVISRSIGDGDDAAHRGVFTACILALELLFLRLNLSENRTARGGALAGSFGIANGITLFRGIGIAFLGGFLLSPRPAGTAAWLPALLWAAAAAADWLDGYAARKSGFASLLGARLDMELDGLGMLIASALTVRYGLLPAPLLLIGLARYLFLAGIGYRTIRGLPLAPTPKNPWSRLLAGTQMTLFALILVPGMPPRFALALELPVALLFLGGFLRDWMVVSCRLPPVRKAAAG